MLARYNVHKFQILRPPTAPTFPSLTVHVVAFPSGINCFNFDKIAQLLH